jgi:regulatory protein
MAGPRRSREPARPLDCHERALRLLSVRPRSRRELRDRLLRAGFEPEEVESELARLEEVGLVDDERFARALAEQQVLGRGAGGRAVMAALSARGVDRSTAEAALAEVERAGEAPDEEERARALALARVGRLRGLPPERAYGRLVAFLVRRGHAPEVAREAARAALGPGPGEASP